ncbi:MAG: hypothetical protein WBG89_05550 [Ornithinimicrobium sp.]
MTSPAPWAIADARAQWRSDIAAIAPEAGAALWDAEGLFIIRSWTEPHRAYHSLRHVAEMLLALRELADHGVALSPRALTVARMAIWFHDVSYDPRATPGSNEQRSATLARDHLHRLGAETADIDAVEALVLMTVDHQVPGAARAEVLDPDLLEAFHDIDLWILSAPAPRYREYARQVRDEFAHVPSELFAAGRRHILQGFAERPDIYRTAHAQQRWQERARSNLSTEIAALT